MGYVSECESALVAGMVIRPAMKLIKGLKGGFIMDKNQAIGYMIIALKESGITDKETIKTVIRNMAIAIDEFTEEYAEKIADEY